MSEFITESIAGWGNFPVQSCRLCRPEKRRDVTALVAAASSHTFIGRGLGRSYGDAALNEDQNVMILTRLNRMISFDAGSGILECEGGVTLDEIIDVFLPRGFFLTVSPGTRFVTVGGAIASDVHGKNHHVDGTIGATLDSLRLLSPSGEQLTCTREDQGEIFRATLGGMGLTGIILSARLRLRRVESAYLHVDYERAPSVEHTLDAFEQDDERYRYSVAWIDCLHGNGTLGRGVLMRGDHAPQADLPVSLRDRPFETTRRRSRPPRVPAFALNRLSIKAFNAAYYRRQTEGRRLVDYNAFFYPLDRLQQWNRIYGRRGFIQYQFVLPEASGRKGLLTILDRIAQAKQAPFLAVLKRFGPAGEGLLSFPMRGPTLALDLPNTGEPLIKLVRELDAMVLDHGGRVYLAKDACLRPEALGPMYPNLDAFRQIQAKLDPNGRFSSSLARRVGLLEP